MIYKILFSFLGGCLLTGNLFLPANAQVPVGDIGDKNPVIYEDYKRLQLDQTMLEQKKGDESQANRIPLPGEGNYDPIIKNNIVKDIIDTKPTGTQTTVRWVFQRISGVRTPLTIFNVLVGVVALTYLIYVAISFFFADGDPEKIGKARKHVAWIILGLAVVSVAEFTAFQLLDPSTEVAEPRLASDTTARLLGMKIDQIIDYVEIFITGVILVLLGISGYNMITGSEAEEIATNEKKFLTSFVTGAALILLAEVISLIFSNRNPQDAIFSGANQILGIINYALSFIAIASFVMLILSGFYYVSSFGNDDQMNRAKKIILGCVLGIVVAISSYVLSTFMIR